MAEGIDEITSRLQSAAERLRSDDLSVDEAAVLIDQCAALAGQACSELASSASAAAQALPAGQDRLL